MLPTDHIMFDNEFYCVCEIHLPFHVHAKEDSADEEKIRYAYSVDRIARLSYLRSKHVSPISLLDASPPRSNRNVVIEKPNHHNMRGSREEFEMSPSRVWAGEITFFCASLFSKFLKRHFETIKY